MKSGLILAYHRVAETVHDPFRLAIRPDEFIAQLRLLRAGYTPSRLEDVGRPAARPRVVITFDDGYADNLHVAAPIAERMGFPMVVYVTTGVLDDARGLWWDRLAAICLRSISGGRFPTEVDLLSGPDRFTARCGGSEAVPWLRDVLHARLRRQRRHVIETTLDALADQLGVAPGGAADSRPLSSVEVVDLASLDHVTIGAHTADHELLPLLSPVDQESQMSRSRRLLEDLIGGSVRHLAYPFGGPDAFDRATVAAARRLGFATAATTLPGAVHRLTPRLRLPRHIADPALLSELGGTTAGFGKNALRSRVPAAPGR